MSVVTCVEGDGLFAMAAGLMRRYREAMVPPPAVLYVTQNCCSLVGPSPTAALFHEWDQVPIRLDAWYFMQRFTGGVTTRSHLMFGPFMTQLSYAIFEWDRDELTQLKKAKQSMVGENAHIQLSSKELVRHCRRTTRAVASAERLIQELLDRFWDLRNNAGVPLFNHAKMEEIWRTQRLHLHCIQDPPGLALYTKTGEVTKGGVRLPVYRCARGATSVKSFHLHMNHFIPGEF